MHPIRVTALLSALLAVPASPATAAEPELSMPSCVRGSPPLVLSARAARARLDGADRRQFERAAAARYPLYQRGGFVPSDVLLMRRGGQWQYVTLWPDGGRGLCVTAVFAADRFDFTDRWLGKYQPREADPDD